MHSNDLRCILPFGRNRNLELSTPQLTKQQLLINSEQLENVAVDAATCRYVSWRQISIGTTAAEQIPLHKIKSFIFGDNILG